MKNSVIQKPQTQPKGVLILLLTALIWGTSFVSQSVGMESVDAFTFNGIRTLLGATVLIPFILIRDKVNSKNMNKQQLIERKNQNKVTIKCGIIIGVVLCCASNLQQCAFYYSSAGKIAFITAMYMFFVPLVGLFVGKRIPIVTWICILLGFVGLYLLSFSSGKSISDLNLGDIIAFLCAICFCVQILLIEKYINYCDGVKLSCVQFYTSGIITIILMFIFEKPELKAIKAAIIPILYSGILSCGLAYTFQIIGQKYCEATIASLLMCMESVFAVIAAAIIIHEKMSRREVLGCIIMFIAILITQLSDVYKKHNHSVD